MYYRFMYRLFKVGSFLLFFRFIIKNGKLWIKVSKDRVEVRDF